LTQDFRAALEFQEKSHEMIKKIMPEESAFVKQSQMQLHELINKSVYQEKLKQIEKNNQGIGSGKRQIGENKAKMTEKEKQELQNRQKIEQYLKKMSKMPNAGLPKDGKGGFYSLLEQQQKKK
jgi:hypothetical protein